MQILLPLPTFSASAACLHDDDLRVQVLDCEELFLKITRKPVGFRNALINSWVKFPEGLSVYGLYVSAEYRDRGGDSDYFDMFQEERLRLREGRKGATTFPKFCKNEDVNLMFQEWLIWRDPQHYGPQFPETEEFFTEPRLNWEDIRGAR